MRIDKLTTKLQEALADAQSLALKHDNASIESAHLVLALLEQHDSVGPLLQRSGVDTKALAKSVTALMDRLPKTQSSEQVQVGREVVTLLQLAEKESMKEATNLSQVSSFLCPV
jgi:ATP-dependent Clp protease ATP-binding subunit ClpB